MTSVERSRFEDFLGNEPFSENPNPLVIVAALDSSGLIGSASGLPWSIPEEYRHFQHLIQGQRVLIGRRSYEIFGSDMKESTVSVLSRSITSLPGVAVYNSLESALVAATATGPGFLFSAGGRQVYKQALPIAQYLCLSYIKGQYHGDCYFPTIDKNEWREEQRNKHSMFDFVVWRRIFVQKDLNQRSRP